MRSRDPRIRQRINQISHNLESANETAQEGLYTFSHNYISPCFASLGNCVYACTAPCLPTREDHLRRRRRGRAEAVFDFYDDWDNEDADDTLLSWGAGELDRLLAGSGLTQGTAEQPRRPRKMSYGTRNPRRRSTVHIPDNRTDPTIIPSSSLLGFLERFPWRFGARGVKYRPSAADLQEQPSGLHRFAQEEEPLMEAADEDLIRPSNSPDGRNRSATQSSLGTTNSLSSRGDLFPSDEEEDAVPLDDEFAFVLGHRGTGLEDDDQSGTKSEMAKPASGTSSLTGTSSKKKAKRKKKRSTKSPASDVAVVQGLDTPSMADLKLEEQHAALEEESAIQRRRAGAHELALSRGLEDEVDPHSLTSAQSTRLPTESSPLISPTMERPTHSRQWSESSSRRFSDDHTEPFPSFEAGSPNQPGGTDMDGPH